MSKNHPKSILTALILAATGLSASGAEDSGTPPELTGVELKAVVGSKQKEAKIPHLEEPFIDTSPADMNDGLGVGESGPEKEAALALAGELAGGDTLVDSFLIASKGKLVFESYFRRGRVDVPHYQMSITKSYTALALGRAMQLGHLTMADLDKPVVSFLDKVDRSKLAKGTETITLAEVLNMGSGIIPGDKAAVRGKKGQAYVQALLENCKPIEKKVHNYQACDPDIVMVVIDSIVPGKAGDFIRKELLGKLGISSFDWGRAPTGVPLAAAGSCMRSRDMIKWGLLLANKGKWNGEQLIPAAFIEKASSAIYANPRKNYGFFLYHSDVEANGTKTVRKSARGAGGQYIICFPEQQLVVVFTCHQKGMPRQLVDLATERLLPALMKKP